MTEDEAKTKWCPMVRVSPMNSLRGADIGNREKSGDDRCIGSACMMWRWIYGPGHEKALGLARGYCGLAGKP